MKFSLFKRKRKTKRLNLDELEIELKSRIENNRKLVEEIVESYSGRLNSLVNELLNELEKFDPSLLHPTLVSIAKNFKSSMLKMWKNNSDYESIRKNVEKTALFKLKHYRTLFGVNPEEMNRINEIASEIASIVSTIESKRDSINSDNLNAAIIEINKIRNLNKNKKKLEQDKTILMEKLQSCKSIESEASEIETKIKKLEGEIKNLEREIAMREDYIRKLVATAKKAIKSFAHKSGIKVNFEDLNELRSISRKVAVEIEKGELKVKDTQIKKVTSALNKIENHVPSKLKEIEILKGELISKRSEMQKLKAKIPRFDAELVEMKIKSIDKKIEKVIKERNEVKESLERLASKIFECDVVIEDQLK